MLCAWSHVTLEIVVPCGHLNKWFLPEIKCLKFRVHFFILCHKKCHCWEHCICIYLQDMKVYPCTLKNLHGKVGLRTDDKVKFWMSLLLQILISRCHNWEEETSEDVDPALVNALIPPYVTLEGEDGATVNMTSAISLVNRSVFAVYCSPFSK